MLAVAFPLHLKSSANEGADDRAAHAQADHWCASDDHPATDPAADASAGGAGVWRRGQGRDGTMRSHRRPSVRLPQHVPELHELQVRLLSRPCGGSGDPEGRSAPACRRRERAGRFLQSALAGADLSTSLVRLVYHPGKAIFSTVQLLVLDGRRPQQRQG
ncbi:unnamed protein product [Phaeothamnion confervicola]